MKGPWSTLIWIVALAFLSVGARNFELGMSVDGPLYASIARNLSTLGSWWFLDPGIPDFIPFAEHPHFGFWVWGLWLKIFPAEDWAIRIVGHLYYVGFLFLFFTWVKKFSGEKAATWSVLLLWVFSLFSNIHSNVYLDPGLLFWGTLSLALCFSPKKVLPRYQVMLAALAFAIAVLYKGVMSVPFGVPLLYCLYLQLRIDAKKTALHTLLFLFITAAILGAYVAGIRNSEVPDFLSLYWNRQIGERFGPGWQFRTIFEWEYWKKLLQNTHFLAPLAFITLRDLKKPQIALAWIGFTVYATIFAGAGLAGNQYLIMVMPWLAWLIAEGVLIKIPVTARKLMKVTGGLAVIAVLFLQYIPFRTHKLDPGPIFREIRSLRPEFIYLDIHARHVDKHRGPSKFLTSSHYAWYGNTRVEYPTMENFPRARKGVLYLTERHEPDRMALLPKNGWCEHPNPEYKPSLWIPCER